MATALWGYKTFNRSEVPVLIWIGDNLENGFKALRDVAEKHSLVRAERQQLFGGIPVPVPESESAKARRLVAEAEVRDATAKAKASEVLRAANAALEKAKKEAADAEASIASLAGDKTDLRARRK